MTRHHRESDDIPMARRNPAVAAFRWSVRHGHLVSDRRWPGDVRRVAAAVGATGRCQRVTGGGPYIPRVWVSIISMDDCGMPK